MYKSLVTLRYAKALFLQAEEEGQSEQVLADVTSILKLFKDSPEFFQVIKHPVIQTSQKQKLVHDLLKDHISPVMLRFLQLVLKNKREGYLADIFRNYRDIFNQNRGIKSVELTTAIEMDQKEKEVIKTLIRKYFHARKVDFHEHIDPGIIGGFVIQIEDQLLDASVRRQLEMIKKTLLNKKFNLQNT